jgi:hypothetical protein
METMKGQITMINLVILFVTFVMAMTLLPVLQNISVGVEACMMATTPSLACPEASGPTSMTTATIAIINLIPFAIVLMILLTGFYFAIPRREGY